MTAQLTITFQAPPEEADQLAREVSDWYEDDEELRPTVRLVMAEAESGKMGGLATAVELVGAVEPLLTAAVGAFGYWLGQRVSARPVSFEVTRPDGSSRKITATEGTLDDALRRFEEFADDQPADGTP
ncbi:hypothetical protein QNO07_18880 [Streptomyces sp. 549]|uniref:effector-associated constant component EACC1 n=1 Tax=Streptomyces sp. 549 TaxID=3049076 RepID=UPI0024C20F50|nr:hypothetical protein [Streptomyces sp. 549]MDK1475458.1 hypothetical protein [Streptomyces sp. 549]